jgi:flagellar basal body P-ring protein FlgI
MIEAVVPEQGAREGELLDVRVTAVAAKSLTGGQLLPTPLVYHDPAVAGLFAFAQGRIVTTANSLTTGVVRGGARMERDVLISVVARGADLEAAGFSSPWIRAESSYVTLVLDEAHSGWAMAAAVAQAVDKELASTADTDRVALALDSKNIAVLLPDHQLGDPASWIRDVERAPMLLESNEARVSINRIAKTIVVTGDTRISPVIVSQAGLTVSVDETPANGVASRAAEAQFFVPVDIAADRTPNVRHLLEALNRLKVSFDDRVSIIEEIHRVGKLHARLMYEG